jgi:hypothetical protein
MPNQTIDLSRDCEAWYDFDTDYFDSQRGIIQDRSGHGRHAQAKGGPTVGVNGPDSFEGARLDGTDDYFKPTGFPDGVLKSNEFTVFALATRAEQSDDGDLLNQSRGDGFRFRYRESAGEFRFAFYDGNGDYTAIKVPISESFGTHTFIAEHSASDVFRLTIDDKIRATLSGVGYTPPLGGNESLYIGADYEGASRFVTGDIHAVGLWSRALSDAEREYLNRLTAPRRSQL